MTGKRKFYFSSGVFLCCCLLLAFGKLTNDSFESIVITIMYAFIGGNVGEHVSGKLKDITEAFKSRKNVNDV